MAGGCIGGLAAGLLVSLGKTVDEKIKSKKEKERLTKKDNYQIKNGWKCPKCGKMNSHIINICDCGYEDIT